MDTTITLSDATSIVGFVGARFQPRMARIAVCTARRSAGTTLPIREACVASMVAILAGRTTDGIDRPARRGLDR